MTYSTGILKGVVSDTNGKPIEGASLTAFIGNPEPAICYTKEDGSFTFECVVPGVRFIHVAARGFMASTQDANVVKGKVTEMAFELQKGTYEITGRITEDGKYPLKAEVSLLKAGIAIQEARSENKRGTYRFGSLAAGFYEVQANSICHEARAWSGEVGGYTRVNLALPAVEGCAVEEECDVCGVRKEVRYCRLCHAYICSECRRNYPERVKAMLKRRFLKRDKSEDDLQAELERELEEPVRRAEDHRVSESVNSWLAQSTLRETSLPNLPFAAAGLTTVLAAAFCLAISLSRRLRPRFRAP